MALFKSEGDRLGKQLGFRNRAASSNLLLSVAVIVVLAIVAYVYLRDRGPSIPAVPNDPGALLTPAHTTKK